MLPRAQTKPCRRMFCGCSEGQRRVEELWILFAGVGEQGAALQAVSASPVLHMGEQVGASLAIRPPHRKLGRGVVWQHDHGQENWGPLHMPSEHGERHTEKRGSKCQPQCFSSWTCYPKGRSLPNQALWEIPDSQEPYAVQGYPLPPKTTPSLLLNSLIFPSGCIKSFTVHSVTRSED